VQDAKKLDANQNFVIRHVQMSAPPMYVKSARRMDVRISFVNYVLIVLWIARLVKTQSHALSIHIVPNATVLLQSFVKNVNCMIVHMKNAINCVKRNVIFATNVRNHIADIQFVSRNAKSNVHPLIVKRIVKDQNV
jgi:hypothetical protein